MKKIRYLAGALAALLLISLLAGCGGKKEPEGLFYKASGIDPKSTIAAVNGREITAEEYLYWLAYECERIAADRGSVKWGEVIADGITYGEYAKRTALADVTQYAAARTMAEKSGVTLSQEDREQLQQNKDEDISRSGGREEYLRHLAMMGISEEAYDRINEGHMLLTRLMELGGTEGSPVYPTEQELEAFSQGKDFTTVRLIALPIAGLDEKARADQQTLLADCAEQIREAEDPCAKLAELSESLGQSDGDRDQTLGSDIIDPTLMKAVGELKEGEVSDVVTTAGAMCVALRRPLDESAIAREYFDRRLVEARTTAKVEVSASYKSLDVGKFYPALVELRKTMFDEPAVNE